MPQVASDIIVTGAKVYLAPVSTALPAPSLSTGGTWPTGWVDVGYTLESTKLTYQFDVMEIFVEQQFSPVRRRRTKETASIETQLAELTAGNLEIAMAGIATSHAASAGVVGYEDFEVGGEPNLDTFMVGIEGDYNDEDNASFPIRLFAYQATVDGGGTLDLAKDKAIGIPLKLVVMPDNTKPRGTRLLRIQKVLEPAV